MEPKAMKFAFIIGLVLVLTIGDLKVALGQCSKDPNRDAVQLFPCLNAAKDRNAPPSSTCCSKVAAMGQNPQCLCAAMLSNTAKSVGAKPEISVTIPKRCNIANRPVGYRCGPYTLP